ncbi:hypothetical protein MD484_g4744, partial [Candolleomyces efflorescens]
MLRLAGRPKVLSRRQASNVVGRNLLNVEQRRRMTSRLEETNRDRSKPNRLKRAALILSLGTSGYILFSVWRTEKAHPNRKPWNRSPGHAAFLYDACLVESSGGLPGIARYDASSTPSPVVAIQKYSPEAGNLFAFGILDMPKSAEYELSSSLLDYMVSSAVSPSMEHSTSTATEIAHLKSRFLAADQLVHKVCEGYVKHYSSIFTQYPVLVRLYPTGPAPYFSWGASALVGLYNSNTRTLSVALTGDARAVMGRPLHNPSYKPSDNPIQDLKSELAQKDSTLPPRKRSDYDTVYQVIALTADQVPSNVEEKERLEALHPGKRLFLDSADDSTQKTFLGLSTTRALGQGCLKWPLEFQRRIRDVSSGENDIPPFFKYGELPVPPGTGFHSSSNSSTPDAPDDPRPPSIEPIRDEALAKAAPSGKDTWNSATDVDALELDATLSPLPALASAPAENPYLTAEPEITTVHVKPGDFIVLGTKGFFECLSDEDIVGLVGAWAEERRRTPSLPQYARIEKEPLPDFMQEHAIAKKKLEAAQEPWDIFEAVLNHSIRIPKYLSGRLAQSRESGLAVDPNLRLKVSRNWSSETLEGPMGKDLTPMRRMVDREELPVVRGRDVEAQSTQEGRGGDVDPDHALLELGFKNSKLNAASSVAPKFPYSWRNQESRFAVVEGDLCSVSAHLIRNAFNTKGRDLYGAELTHQLEMLKKYRDNFAVQVIFFD